METLAPQRGRHANAQIQFAILTLLAGIASAHAQTAPADQTPEANAASTILIVLTVVLTAIALKVQGDPASTAGGHAALDRTQKRP